MPRSARRSWSSPSAPRWPNFDWTLLRAAASLGAGPLTAARRVMLPLIAPGVIFGALLAFATSLEEVVVVLIVGGPGQRTLPREMFVQLREHISPTLAAAAVLLMVISAVLLPPSRCCACATNG